MEHEHSSHDHTRLLAEAADAHDAATSLRDQARVLRTSSQQLCAASQAARRSFNWFYD